MGARGLSRKGMRLRALEPGKRWARLLLFIVVFEELVHGLRGDVQQTRGFALVPFGDFERAEDDPSAHVSKISF